MSPTYRAQVDLLIRVLPYIAMEESLALKGGTAINLFVRDMPRLSVDVDLTHLPISSYQDALQSISLSLRNIKKRIQQAVPELSVTIPMQSGGIEIKLFCQSPDALVKVEVNTTIRGHLWPVQQLEICQAAQNEFGMSAVVNVVSKAELYGGKICAALDRQHPRDLFDIQHLLAHEGITEEIRWGFLASLVSHNRPINEVLNPNFQDRQDLLASHFAGMATVPFSYDDFQKTRDTLRQQIHSCLTADDRTFLVTFKRGEPDWSLFPVEALRRMPAVDWKLSNIRKLKSENPVKHSQQLAALERVLAE